MIGRRGFVRCPVCSGTYHRNSVSRHYRTHGREKCEECGCFNVAVLDVPDRSFPWCPEHESAF